MRRQFVVVELTEHDGLLLRQHAGVEQLGQHPFNAVRMLAHVFEEQHTTFDLREIRRAQQRDQDR